MNMRNVVLLILLAVSAPVVAGGAEVIMPYRVTMTEKQFKLIELARSRFLEVRESLEGYAISYFEIDDTYVVIFHDPEISPTQRGSSPRIASFEVKLDSDGNVVSANFIR